MRITKDLKPGMSFVMNDKRYAYLGKDEFEIEELPDRVEPPNRHMAKSFLQKSGSVEFGDTECCHNCIHFRISLFSSPCGWCGKHKCKAVNCSEFEVCDDFTKEYSDEDVIVLGGNNNESDH